MWQIKKEQVVSHGILLERVFMQQSDGPKVWRVAFDKDDKVVEAFRYEHGALSFSFGASRRDFTSGIVTLRYIVWLGIALEAISARHPITIDQARQISKDIKGALLAYRYPERWALELGFDPAAKEVSFVMERWAKWAPQFEEGWP